MRLIKMAGLAMVAAIAAMALVGAGSASATTTVLCKDHACKEPLSGIVQIDGLQILGVGTLLTSLGNIHCQGGHIKAHIEAGLNAGSLLGELLAFEYLECEALLIGCNGKPATVTTAGEPQIHVLYTETNLGHLTILKPSTTVEIKCGGLAGTIKCKFAENDNVLGTIHNLHEEKLLPYVKFTKAPITGPGGGLCPKTGELDVSYELNYLSGVTQLPVFIGP